MRAVRAAQRSATPQPTPTGKLVVSSAPEPASQRPGPATRAPSAAPQRAGAAAASTFAPKVAPSVSRPGTAAGAKKTVAPDRTPPEDAIQYKRHGQRLEEDYLRIEEDAAAGERRRAAAEEAHEKIIQGASPQIQINERIMMWWPAMLCANFIDRAKIELDFVRAVRAVKDFLAPVARRRKAAIRNRLQRAELTRARQATGVPKPTRVMLKEQVSGTFFRDWPDADLETLLECCRPISFALGETIMFDGDLDRCMYILTRGEVSIVIRDKAKGKRRCLETAKVVIPVKLPAYVGEFAMMTQEPRSASIFCKTDVDGYFVTADDFSRCLKFLSPALRRALDLATMARRRQTLEQFFRPSALKLSELSVFHAWDDLGLQELRKSLTAMVVESGTVLYKAGEKHDKVYYVTDGDVALTNEQTGEPVDDHSPVSVGLAVASRARTGELLGAFAGFFRYPTRLETATTVVRCELWAIDFDTLFGICMNFASRLISSRQVLKDQMAHRLVLPPAIKFANLAFVKPIIATGIANWVWNHSGTVLFCDDDTICKEGERANSIIVACHGRVDISYGNRALSALSERADAGPSKNPMQGYRSLHVQPILDAPESGENFVVIGWHEFITQSSHYLCSARACTAVECVVINRSNLEDRLPPALMAALDSKEVIDEVKKIIGNGKFERLADGAFLPANATSAKSNAAGTGVRGMSAAPSYGSRPPTAAKAATTQSSSPQTAGSSAAARPGAAGGVNGRPPTAAQPSSGNATAASRPTTTSRPPTAAVPVAAVAGAKKVDAPPRGTTPSNKTISR